MFSDAAQRASGHCSCGNITISGLSFRAGMVQLRNGSVVVQSLNSVSCCEAGHTHEIRCGKCGDTVLVQYQRGLAFGKLTTRCRSSLHDTTLFKSWTECPRAVAQLIREEPARDDDVFDLGFDEEPCGAPCGDDHVFDEEEETDFELMFGHRGLLLVGSFQTAVAPELFA